MEQAYRLSAGALLYAVLKLHKPGIYGLPNVMPKLSDKDFPAFAQDAELELMDAGCGEGQANMILAALNGTGGYAHISRVEGREQTAELLLFYGAEGILSADAEYSETRELLRLTPLTRAELLEQIQTLADMSAEQEGAQ